jgi:hypothetical protein
LVILWPLYPLLPGSLLIFTRLSLLDFERVRSTF